MFHMGTLLRCGFACGGTRCHCCCTIFRNQSIWRVFLHCALICAAQDVTFSQSWGIWDIQQFSLACEFLYGMPVCTLWAFLFFKCWVKHFLALNTFLQSSQVRCRILSSSEIICFGFICFDVLCSNRSLRLWNLCSQRSHCCFGSSWNSWCLFNEPDWVNAFIQILQT